MVKKNKDIHNKIYYPDKFGDTLIAALENLDSRLSNIEQWALSIEKARQYARKEFKKIEKEDKC